MDKQTYSHFIENGPFRGERRTATTESYVDKDKLKERVAKLVSEGWVVYDKEIITTYDPKTDVTKYHQRLERK